MYFTPFMLTLRITPNLEKCQVKLRGRYNKNTTTINVPKIYQTLYYYSTSIADIPIRPCAVGGVRFTMKSGQDVKWVTNYYKVVTFQ
jgi:hypothetical protein